MASYEVKFVGRGGKETAVIVNGAANRWVALQAAMTAAPPTEDVESVDIESTAPTLVVNA